MRRINLVIVSLLMLFTTLVVANQAPVQVAEAAMSNCQAWFLSSWQGGYAYCSSGSGGSVRVKIWCNNGVQYYGPKVYSPGQTSTKLCPPGYGINAATHILGT